MPITSPSQPVRGAAAAAPGKSLEMPKAGKVNFGQRVGLAQDEKGMVPTRVARLEMPVTPAIRQLINFLGGDAKASALGIKIVGDRVTLPVQVPASSSPKLLEGTARPDPIDDYSPKIFRLSAPLQAAIGAQEKAKGQRFFTVTDPADTDRPGKQGLNFGEDLIGPRGAVLRIFPSKAFDDFNLRLK